MYTIAADLHTHTVVSNHAFNTITEMARAAKEMGLCAIAVTDHGPKEPDSPHPWYFYNLRCLPDRLEGILVLKGVEANVIDLDGTLDMPQKTLAGLDWVIASIHSECLPGVLTKEQATRLWLRVAQDPTVDMIGHSEQAAHVYDYERVARAFAQNHKVVELNGNSRQVRPEGVGNMKALALACKAARCPVALNTDAHSIYQLREGVGHLVRLLEEIEFPEELVVNSSPVRLAEELKRHGKAVVERIGGTI